MRNCAIVMTHCHRGSDLRWGVAILTLLLTLPRLCGAEDELPRCIEPNERLGMSSAVVVADGPLAHTAQLLPVDESGHVVANQFRAQLEKVLDRMDAALKQAESGIQHVAKLNLYVSRNEDAGDVYSVLAKRFAAGTHKPAVSLVVTRLPVAGARVAADAVATTTLDPGSSVRFLPAVRGGQSRPLVAVVPGGTRIYVAGQAERADSLADATRKTLESLRATLTFLGRADRDIVQLKAFVTPMAEAETVRQEVAAFFGDRPAPPLVMVEWKSGAATPIEIELVAWGGKSSADEPVEFLTPPGMSTSPVFSRVARMQHARTIYVSGLYASPASGSRQEPETPEAGEREVKDVFAALERILKQAGGDFRHLVKATYYVSTDATSTKLNELRPNYYDPRRPPAASKAVVSGVGRPALGLTLDMIAVPATGED